jgi:hypothetical protein
MREHPSETELQEFALGEMKNEAKIDAHIQLCDECKSAIATYRLLFATIGEQEKPAFDFNISELVLQKIKSQKKDHSMDSLIFYIGFAVLALLGGAGYWYREFLSGLLIGFGSLFMYLLVATAIIILTFQCVDIYKRYQYKIKSLDFY